MKLPPLLVISDRSRAGDVVGTAIAAFRGGCRFFMLREKDLSTAELTEIGARLFAASRPFGAIIVINSDVDAALAVGVEGVHLPQGSPVAAARGRLGGDRLIGASAHSLEEAAAAAAAGADYVTLSPIFTTASKPGYGPALGMEGLGQVAGAVSVPVFALAGIGPENAAGCIAAGAAGIAVMGGVMAAPDPQEAVRDILAVL